MFCGIVNIFPRKILKHFSNREIIHGRLSIASGRTMIKALSINTAFRLVIHNVNILTKIIPFAFRFTIFFRQTISIIQNYKLTTKDEQFIPQEKLAYFHRVQPHSSQEWSLIVQIFLQSSIILYFLIIHALRFKHIH